MSTIHFTFASLAFTFNRPNEVQASNKAGIHLSHGRSSDSYESIPSICPCHTVAILSWEIKRALFYHAKPHSGNHRGEA